MRHLDLFSGVGGFSLGLERAGFETVAFSEIEAFPCRVLAERWSSIPNLGDVSEITAAQLEALGEIDVVTFGSPCQDWSVAGKRLGLDGHRSSLFHEAIRIIRIVRPRFGVFENVPGLFSSAKRWDFAAVLDEMAESGAMDLAWSVLDAQWFGVPQRRRRIFLIADFGGERAGEILSISEGVCRDTPPSREAGEESTRGSGGGSEEHSTGRSDHKAQPSPAANGAGDGRYAQVLGSAGTLGGGSGSRGWADDTDRMTFIPLQYATSHREKRQNGMGIGVEGDPMFTLDTFANHGVAGALTTRYGKGVNTTADDGAVIPVAFNWQASGADWMNPHPEGTDALHAGQTPAVAQPIPFDTTQITSDKNYSKPREGDPCHPLAAGAHPAAVADQMAVRRLTPLECERLQGFPDSWSDVPGGSDSGRYRAMGNAVAVPVVEWVARRMAKEINQLPPGSVRVL